MTELNNAHVACLETIDTNVALLWLKWHFDKLALVAEKEGWPCGCLQTSPEGTGVIPGNVTVSALHVNAGTSTAIMQQTWQATIVCSCHSHRCCKSCRQYSGSTARLRLTSHSAVLLRRALKQQSCSQSGARRLRLLWTLCASLTSTNLTFWKQMQLCSCKTTQNSVLCTSF